MSLADTEVESAEAIPRSGVFDLPRNVWAASLTSFLTDVSTEMVVNLLPLFLSQVLGVRTNIIGLIEGVAETTASILKLFSGWLSDRIGTRKWLAVAGYGLSALAKPGFYFAASWQAIAAVRWSERLGKGIRTSPRDALVADSVQARDRGLAFGFQRAADTAGEMVGLLVAIVIIWLSQQASSGLTEHTFRTIALVSLVPALLAVLALAVGAKEVAVEGQRAAPKFALRSLGKPFIIFMVIVAIFQLGNSSDAFLILRASERGLSTVAVLAMVATFSLVYSLISTPAGSLSDRVGRRRLIVAGWLVYSVIYLGFGLAQTGWQVWLLYAVYGAYYGMTYGTASALVADLVPAAMRGTAYGTYNAILGLMAFPASAIAGILWQGLGPWNGFGPAAPFLFGSLLALLGALLMLAWMPRTLINAPTGQ